MKRRSRGGAPSSSGDASETTKQSTKAILKPSSKETSTETESSQSTDAKSTQTNIKLNATTQTVVPKSKTPSKVKENSTETAKTKSQSSKSKTKDKKPTGMRSCYKNIWRGIKLLVILMFIPPFLNYVALQREAKELVPEGDLYDIGWGQKIHMSCTGTGVPTVILDAPTGYSSDVWTGVVPLIAKHSRVCTYDRAGLGFSERPYENHSTTDSIQYDKSLGAHPFTVERMAEDMRRLFTSSSQQPKPFILVGSEMGALVSQFYTQFYSQDVAGLVLISPLNEDLFLQDGGTWLNYWFQHLLPSFQTLQLGAAIGVTRMALMVGLISQPLQKADLDDVIINRQKHLLCYPRHLSSVVDEHFFINETFSQMKSMRLIKSLPPTIPVLVLTGNYYDEQLPADLNKAWAKSEQNLLSRRIPHAQHIVINGADRHMIYRRPITIAQHIIKMIRQVKNKK